MVKISEYKIQVIEDNCTGCYLCERICPTAAIVMEGPKSAAIAVVDNTKCVSCLRCIDICDDDALLSLDRQEPVKFGIDPASVDQAVLGELLRKSNLDPDGMSCICSLTTNKEVAAAVIAGAKTMEEVALASGAQSGCLMYCFAPIHRLVTTHWGEMPAPTTKNKWYPTSMTLMDVPEDVACRHPEFSIRLEQEHFVQEMTPKYAAYPAIAPSDIQPSPSTPPSGE